MSPEVRKLLSRYPLRYAEDHISEGFQSISNEQQIMVKNAIRKFVALIPPETSDIGKTFIIHETLINWIHYSKKEDLAKSKMRYRFLSALIAGDAVCMGISELMSLMLTEAGVKNRIIIGYANEGSENNAGPHAWNLVTLPTSKGQQTFHVDTTWDLNHFRQDNPYFLRSDVYMREHKHDWLSERYPLCPNDYPEKIVVNTKGAEKLLCRTLKNVLLSELKTVS